MRFLNFQRTSSSKKTKRSKTIKVQTLPERKLMFWEYVFGPNKKSSSDLSPSTQRQRQTPRRDKENPARLRDPCYQATSAGNVMPISAESAAGTGSSSRMLKNKESESKSPSMYKMPRAVLLNKMMTDGFDEVSV